MILVLRAQLDCLLSFARGLFNSRILVFIAEMKVKAAMEGSLVQFTEKDKPE